MQPWTDLHYVVARVAARQGSRADAGLWARLEVHEDFPGYLMALGGTALAPFVQGLAADATVHQVEEHCREAWKAYVAEVGSWHGPDLAPAFDQLGRLPDLPVLMLLSRGDPAPDWLDAASTPNADTDPSEWTAEFLAALPGAQRAVARAVLDTLSRHARDADALRTHAERQFRRERHPFGQVLAHLACIGADLMALRGALTVRLVLANATDGQEAA